jgi:hypothetical protein
MRLTTACRPTIVAVKPARAARLTTFAVPRKEAVHEAIREAEETCAHSGAAECAVAWDIVEELSAARAEVRGDDPLENERVNRCETDPFDPECRMYDI